MIPIGALLLMLAAKLFKLADQGFKTAIKIMFIVGVSSLVLEVISQLVPSLETIPAVASFVLVSIALAVWLIKKYYALDWGKSLLVWLVWIVLSLVAGFLIGLVAAAIIVAVGLASLDTAVLTVA